VRKAVVGVASVAAVLLLGAGYAGLDVAGAVPGPLTTTPSPTASPLPTAPAATTPADPADPVLPALPTDAPVPDPAVLAGLGALLADPALGTSVSASLVDAATGTDLLSLAADVPRAPASVAKLLTGAAALTTLGPTARATTRVVEGATPEEVVLVAGGDVLLSAGAGNTALVNGHAGLDDLAAATAASLRVDGRTAVTLRLDDALFTGPTTSPGWSPGDVGAGYVAPIAPLAVDEARLAAGEYAPRAADPALAAAQQFGRALAARGVTVLGDGVVRASAVAGARTLGEVTSATTAEQVELMLTTSDNTLAEVLARRVAHALDRPATFDDASAAVAEAVGGLGVDVTGVALQGGSGLGRETRLPVRVLTGLLAAVDSGDHPDLAALASGLPVAAVTGTLLDRYDSADEVAGAGVVRAKTGTLSGVSSLAGYVRDADGRLLAFAVVADAVPPGGSVGARDALDRFTSALVGCGCR